MSFTSLNFLIFVLFVVLAYYIVPQRIRWIVLLIASYCFYLLSSPKTFIFILFTTAVTFFGGKYIGEKNASYQKWLNETGKQLPR